MTETICKCHQISHDEKCQEISLEEKCQEISLGESSHEEICQTFHEGKDLNSHEVISLEEDLEIKNDDSV